MLRSNFISASQTKHITTQTKHNITWDSSGGGKASYYLTVFSIAFPSSSRQYKCAVWTNQWLSRKTEKRPFGLFLSFKKKKKKLAD